MSAIGPGDWVECLHNGTYTRFRAGALYCVSEVMPGPDCGCEVCGQRHGGIRLHGMPLPHDYPERRLRARNWWPACRFRPIYRPKASIIEQLKQPAPDAVRELIAAD